MRVRRRNHKEAKRRIIDMSVIWQQCHNFYKLFKKDSQISPYDLNSNDNPGNIITHVQDRGEIMTNGQRSCGPRYRHDVNEGSSKES
jgi:hypothetical protein